MPDPIRDAVIIYNPLAGRGGTRRARRLDAVRRLLASGGLNTELQPTWGPGAATALARSAVEQGRQLVIVCGGDGTVNEVVNGLARSATPLALLPGGTANVLAKELGIPWNLRRAAELLLRSTPRRIALGQMTPLAASGRARYFMSVAGAGLDGAMVLSVEPALKLHTGIAAYWLEGFRQVFRYTFPEFRVTADGLQLQATLVVVGRTRHYAGPFRITTGADLFEDAFELAVCTTRSPARYLSYVPALWLGQFRHLRDVHIWKATSVRCEPVGSQAVYAQVDGELADRLPVDFKVVPDALTLLVPPGVETVHETGQSDASPSAGAGGKAGTNPWNRLRTR